MTKFGSVFRYERTCVRCHRSMPMTGAITHPKFICAECRERAERKRQAQQPVVPCST